MEQTTVRTRKPRDAGIVCWTWMLCLWTAVFPIWQDGTYAHITRTKWLGMLGGVGITALLALFGVLLARPKKKPYGPASAQLAVIAWLLWLGLACFFGTWHGQTGAGGLPAVWNGSVRYEGMAAQLCYGFILLVCSMRAPKARAVWAAAGAALLAFCLIAALQYSGLNIFGLYPAGRSVRTNYEFQSTIGNIDMVSGYLCMAVPMMLGAVPACRGRLKVLLCAAGFAGTVMLLCIEVQSGLLALLAFALLLGCRALRQPGERPAVCMILAGLCLCVTVRESIRLPWLDGSESLMIAFPGHAGLAAAALGLLCMILARRFRNFPGRALNRKTVAAAAALMIAFVLVLLLVLPVPETAGGLWEIRETLLGRGEDSFGSYRLGVWRETLKMLRSCPGFGLGPDTYWHAFAAHLRSAGKSFPERFDNPHNQYIAMAANGGWPALVIYIIILALVLRRLWLKRARPEAWPLFAVIVCYSVQAFFSFSICMVSPVWWALLGWAAGP